LVDTCLAVLVLTGLIHSRVADAQQLGHKLLGSAGADAGTQPPPGVYIAVRVLGYGADKIRNRDGDIVPIDGLNIDALGVSLGAAYTIKLTHAPYLTFAIALPYASIDINSANPAASLNGFGFADIFLQPLKAGWRQPRFDVVTGYMIYAPTGRYEPRSPGPGRGYWTHQFSAGGAIYSDTTRSSVASALASLELNSEKERIDVRRGNLFQIQGGVAVAVSKTVRVGAAGFTLWQVSHDLGRDIPPPLRNEWTRAFGLGPEIGIIVPPLRLRVDVRVEREFGVRSRTQGTVAAVSVSHAANLGRSRMPR
jgi:hypothetical protein